MPSEAIAIIIPLGIVFIVVGIPVISGTLITLAKILRSGQNNRSESESTDEARLLQDIYRSLNKMEERIEALETILIERDREKSHRKTNE